MINKKIINIRKSLDKLDDQFLRLIKKRTSHPIFSFAMIGKERKYIKSSLNTCFGKESLFDNFKKK